MEEEVEEERDHQDEWDDFSMQEGEIGVHEQLENFVDYENEDGEGEDGDGIEDGEDEGGDEGEGFELEIG